MYFSHCHVRLWDGGRFLIFFASIVSTNVLRTLWCPPGVTAVDVNSLWHSLVDAYVPYVNASEGNMTKRPRDFFPRFSWEDHLGVGWSWRHDVYSLEFPKQNDVIEPSKIIDKDVGWQVEWISMNMQSNSFREGTFCCFHHGFTPAYKKWPWNPTLIHTICFWRAYNG